MNLDSLSFTLSQISYLVASLTKKNYKEVVVDLQKVSEGFKIKHSLIIMTNGCIRHIDHFRHVLQF